MQNFDRGDIVRVPLPYADRPVRYHRPALVVASNVGPGNMLIWVAMITAAENRGWQRDVEISNHISAGLPIPSVVRTAKITTIEARRAEWRGRVAAETMHAVDAAVAAWLDLRPMSEPEGAST